MHNGQPSRVDRLAEYDVYHCTILQDLLGDLCRARWTIYHAL